MKKYKSFLEAKRSSAGSGAAWGSETDTDFFIKELKKRGWIETTISNSLMFNQSIFRDVSNCPGLKKDNIFITSPNYSIKTTGDKGLFLVLIFINGKWVPIDDRRRFYNVTECDFPENKEDYVITLINKIEKTIKVTKPILAVSEHLEDIIDDMADLEEIYDIKFTLNYNKPFLSKPILFKSLSGKIDEIRYDYNSDEVSDLAKYCGWKVVYGANETYENKIEDLIKASKKLEKVDYYTRLEDKIKRHKFLKCKHIYESKIIETAQFGSGKTRSIDGKPQYLGRQELANILNKDIKDIMPIMNLYYKVTYIYADIEDINKLEEEVNEGIIDAIKAPFIKNPDEIIPASTSVELKRKGFKYDYNKCTHSISMWEYEYKDMKFYLQFTGFKTIFGMSPGTAIFYLDKLSNRIKFITDIPTDNKSSFKGVSNIDFQVSFSNFNVNSTLNKIKVMYTLINSWYNRISEDEIKDELSYLLESLDMKVDRFEYGIVPQVNREFSKMNAIARKYYEKTVENDVRNLYKSNVNVKEIRVGYDLIVHPIIVDTEADIYYKKKFISDQLDKLSKRIGMEVDYQVIHKKVDYEDKYRIFISALLIYNKVKI